VSDRYDSLIHHYAAQRSVPWTLIKAQIRQESRFDPEAVSPRGAVGLMQFMKPTWEDAKRFTPLPNDADRRNPEHSIAAGCAYMRWILDQLAVQGDMTKALVAYNYGIGNLRRLLAAYGALWQTHLPAEPLNYFQRIAVYEREYAAMPNPVAQIARLQGAMLEATAVLQRAM
jgi:soluble lytic murein transglycosylase